MPSAMALVSHFKRLNLRKLKFNFYKNRTNIYFINNFLTRQSLGYTLPTKLLLVAEKYDKILQPGNFLLHTVVNSCLPVNKKSADSV